MLEVPEEKIIAVEDHAKSPLFDERERLALEYADCMTLSDRDVSDELFGRLKDVFDEDERLRHLREGKTGRHKS